MRAVVWAAIAVVLLLCGFAVWWLFWGPPAEPDMVGNANVVGALFAVAALLVALVPLLLAWRSRQVRRAAAAGAVVTIAPVDAAAGDLAVETLRYWREQAKARRIVTPSPVSVRWRWADENVGVPAAQLRPKGAVLTAGVVNQLREQLYDRLGNRVRLVLLGQAGAGKTAAMLLLLIDVLEHRKPGEPVPVWLTLGSWDPSTTSLREWAAATLTRDHPGLFAADGGGARAALRLIDMGSVALFLDGLDEMEPALQGVALEAIDRHGGGVRVVLTSRPDQYQAALDRGRLYGAAVVELLDVDVDQAEAFLLAEQFGIQRAAWKDVVDRMRAEPDSVVARTLTTPLTLSLAREAYPGGSAASEPKALLDAKAHADPDALRRDLLARFFDRAYPDDAERDHAIHWLAWIARHLGASRDLRWWDMPTWVPHLTITASGLLAMVAGLVVALVAGVFGLVVGLGAGLAVGLGVGLVWGRLFAEALKWTYPTTLHVRWPRKGEWRRVGRGHSLTGLGPGLVVGVAIWERATPAIGLIAGLVAAAMSVLVTGLPLIWSAPLGSSHAVTPLTVYQADLRKSAVVSLTFGLVLVLGVGLGVGLAFGLHTGLASGLAFGLVFGPAAGVGPAVWLCLAQVVWLVRCRSVVRFLPLLETALQRQVLRQVGAVYQFRHASLQEYLAGLEPGPAPYGSRATEGI